MLHPSALAPMVSRLKPGFVPVFLCPEKGLELGAKSYINYSMNKILCDLEEYLMTDAAETALVLGVSEPHYYAMRNETRKMPKYIVNHVSTIRKLSQKQLSKMLTERLNDGS